MPGICHLLCIHPANHVKAGGKNRSTLRTPRAHALVAFVTLARLSVCSEASWRQGQTLASVYLRILFSPSQALAEPTC